MLVGIGAGFSFFWLISHPKSGVKKKFPQKNIKNFHFSPNIKIIKDNKVYHFHHWLIFSFVYLPLLVTKRDFLKYKAIHGFILGSIIQGLTFKDRFSLVYLQNRE